MRFKVNLLTSKLNPRHNSFSNASLVIPTHSRRNEVIATWTRYRSTRKSITRDPRILTQSSERIRSRESLSLFLSKISTTDSKNTRYGKRKVAENRETGMENGQRRRERWIVNALYCQRMPRRKNAIRGEGLDQRTGDALLTRHLI